MAIDGFENILLNRISSHKIEDNKKVFIIFTSGNRSMSAVNQLIEKGIKDL